MIINSSPTSSEHWMTLMTCTVCYQTPDNSPIYKCNLGHTVCYPCFRILAAKGIPTCKICESDKFTRQDVSPDFLQKLKTKPGIGRPRRYVEIDDEGQMLHHTKYMSESVTVEKLFQLSASKLQQLFDETARERIRSFNNFDIANGKDLRSRINLRSESRDEVISTSKTLTDKSSKVWLKKTCYDSKVGLNYNASSGCLQSRKPLKCPHDPCNKIIALSSFQLHFKFEHFDFKRFHLERGKELILHFDAADIQHGKGICLGIIQLFEFEKAKDSSKINMVASTQKLSRIELDTFWIMVSGSIDDRPNHAYAIFWLFTNNDNDYNCTLEVSSHKDAMTNTTFCAVNGIHESQNISEVTQRLNCLYITHGTIRSMLGYGPTLKLQIIIH